MRAALSCLAALGCAQPVQSERRVAEVVSATGTIPVDTTGPDDSSAEDSGFLPREGEWELSQVDPLEDSCAIGDVALPTPGETFNLSLVSSEAFALDHTRGSDHCVLTDQDAFSCDPRSEDDWSLYEEYGLDAVLTFSLESGGHFGSEDQMAWASSVEMSCSGADCAWAELLGTSFPCVLTFDITALATL